jgi:hypothetical protein
MDSFSAFGASVGQSEALEKGSARPVDLGDLELTPEDATELGLHSFDSIPGP